jgi:hypothetical protein
LILRRSCLVWRVLRSGRSGKSDAWNTEIHSLRQRPGVRRQCHATMVDPCCRGKALHRARLSLGQWLRRELPQSLPLRFLGNGDLRWAQRGLIPHSCLARGLNRLCLNPTRAPASGLWLPPTGSRRGIPPPTFIHAQRTLLQLRFRRLSGWRTWQRKTYLRTWINSWGNAETNLDHS